MTLQKLAIALSLAGLVISSPLTLKVKRTRASQARKEVSPTAGLYQYLSSFETVLNAITKRQSADLSVDVTNLDNYKYTTTVFIGSNKQELDLTIDTGVNRLVLLDSSCVECQYTFNSSKSTSF